MCFSPRFVADALAVSPAHTGQVLALPPSGTAILWGAPLFEHQLSALLPGEDPWPVAGHTGQLPMFGSTDYGRPLLFEVMSKLALNVATAQADDVKTRLRVSIGGVTAACLTFINTHAKFNSVTFSKEASLVSVQCVGACVPPRCSRCLHVSPA